MSHCAKKVLSHPADDDSEESSYSPPRTRQKARREEQNTQKAERWFQGEDEDESDISDKDSAEEIQLHRINHKLQGANQMIPTKTLNPLPGVEERGNAVDVKAKKELSHPVDNDSEESSYSPPRTRQKARREEQNTQKAERWFQGEDEDESDISDKDSAEEIQLHRINHKLQGANQMIPTKTLNPLPGVEERGNAVDVKAKKELSHPVDNDSEESSYSPPRTRQTARREEQNTQQAERWFQGEDEDASDISDKDSAEEIQLHRINHKLQGANQMIPKETLNPLPEVEQRGNAVDVKATRASTSAIEAIMQRPVKVILDDIMEGSAITNAETPDLSSPVADEEGGIPDNQEIVELQALATAARMIIVYRCKICTEEGLLFTEEKRTDHHHMFHKDSKTYNVDLDQEDQIVVLCIRCQHLAIMLEDWDQHLCQHKLSQRLSIASPNQ